MFKLTFASFQWLYDRAFQCLRPKAISYNLFLVLTLCIAYRAGHDNALGRLVAWFKQKPREITSVFRPELPPLSTPPSATDPRIQDASCKLDARLQKLYAGGLVESLTDQYLRKAMGFRMPKNLNIRIGGKG